MSNTAKARGSAFERGVREYLRDQGLRVDHLRLSGTDDQGDLYVHQGDAVLELKATKRLNLSGFLKEAQLEAENYAKAQRRGGDVPASFAVVKAMGKGIGKAYVVTDLDSWIALQKRAAKHD